jgi:putative flippase GtrA
MRISILRHQPVRYVINGVIATIVTYSVLSACIHVAHIPSAGISNFIAAVVGISASFIGNRNFVFPGGRESLWHQLGRFWILYAVLAVMQGVVMYVWADLAGLNYRIGFLIGTFLQMVFSYLGGKHWVFRK